MTRSMTLKAWLLMSVGAALAAAAPASAAGSAATAADASKGVSVETLVVTARRREEKLFDVAGPVTAISGDAIRAFNMEDLKTVMDQVPNAVLPKSPDNYVTYIYIRGIQQTDVQAQPNFGTYRNGVYAGGERPNFGSMIDLDRVEVLAGPQAGLYGRDAVGGAINVVYATPKDSFGGYLQADYGRHERTDLQGAVNMPLAKGLAMRLAGWYLEQDSGEIYNSLLNTYVDRSRHDGFRFSLKAEPTDRLTALWIVEYDDNRGPSVETYAPKGVTNLLAHSPNEVPGLISRNTPDINWNNQIYVSQDLKYRTDGYGLFQLLASYSDYHMHDIEDADKSGLDPATSLSATTVLRRKEEVRNAYVEGLWTSPDFGPLSLTGGLSYFDQQFNFGRTYTTTIDLDYLAPVSALACGYFLGNPACPGVPGGAFPAIGLQSAAFNAPDGASTIGTRSFSVFGQATLRVNSKLSIIGSLRYTDDHEDLNFHQFPGAAISAGSAYITALYANTFPAITLVKGYNYSNVSPSVEVNYRPWDNVNLYALYSTGFRAGGFNTSTTSADLIPYGSENAENYESGIKTRWLGGRLSVNVDAFLMYQHNLLEYQPDPIAPPQFFFYYLNNVGSARTYGVEFSSQAQITPWWSASATVGWENAQLTGGSSYGYALAGGQLELTRTWTFNLQSQIRYPITPKYDLIGAVNYHHESGGYLDITTIAWPDFNRLDATFGVARGRWTLVGYVNNALNDRPPQFVYGNGATTLTQGSTYGARVSYRF